MKKEYKEKLIRDELMIMDEIDRICTEDNINYFLTAGTLLGAVRHGGLIPWDDDMDIAMPRKDFEKFVNTSYKKLKENFFLDYYNTNKKYGKSFAKVRLKGTYFKESKLGKNLDWQIWIDIFPLDDIQSNYINKAKKNKKKIKYLNSILEKKFILNFNSYKSIKSRTLYIISKILPSKLIIKLRNYYMNKYNDDKNLMFINYGSQYSVEKQIHEKSKYFPTKKIKFENKKYNAPNDIDYVLKKIYGDNYMELPPIEKRVSHDPLYIKFSDGEYIDFTNNSN